MLAEAAWIRQTQDICRWRCSTSADGGRAVKLRERGTTLREVAAQVELSVPTVMSAHRAYQAGGWAAVNV